MGHLAKFLRDERGATAVEYALLLGGIAMALIASLPGLATRMSGAFSYLSTALK